MVSTLFSVGSTYRHSGKSDLDIKIIQMVHYNDAYSEMKIMYLSRQTNNVVYCGNGECGLIDKIKIQSKDYSKWIRL